MVAKRDQQFFDAFMLLAGIFVGIIAGIILLGDLVGDGAGAHAEDGAAQSAVEERIRPIGRVALPGESAPTPPPAAVPTVAPTPPAAAVPTAAPPPPPATTAAAASQSGEAVYNQACALCHTPPGIGGAPAFADRPAWAARLEQGLDVLTDHVINGYQGQAGLMPAKGGRIDLSDEQVLAAMQHMLDAVAQ